MPYANPLMSGSGRWANPWSNPLMQFSDDNGVKGGYWNGNEFVRPPAVNTPRPQPFNPTGPSPVEQSPPPSMEQQNPLDFGSGSTPMGGGDMGGSLGFGGAPNISLGFMPGTSPGDKDYDPNKTGPGGTWTPSTGQIVSGIGSLGSLVAGPAAGILGGALGNAIDMSKVSGNLGKLGLDGPSAWDWTKTTLNQMLNPFSIAGMGPNAEKVSQERAGLTSTGLQEMVNRPGQNVPIDYDAMIRQQYEMNSPAQAAPPAPAPSLQELIDMANALDANMGVTSNDYFDASNNGGYGDYGGDGSWF